MQLIYVDPPTGYIRPLNEPHTEYPKFVHIAGKPAVIVNDADEESAVRAGGEPAAKVPEPEAQPAPVPVLVAVNDEEAMLRKIADEKGIRIDGRWKLPKIRKAVQAASQ